MKIEHTGISPSGDPVINLRLGVADLEIIRGLMHAALISTPRTRSTDKTIQRMRAMSRCFNSGEVAEWVKAGQAPRMTPDGATECINCDGTGLDGWDRCDPPGQYDCEHCDGNGWIKPQ